ncbi:MAG: hypothetical protein ACU0GG_10905 [Paracoccaceae bacterium]
MSALADPMQQKDLTAAVTLYFLGGVFFLHRAYLGDWRPTALTVGTALCSLAALYLFQDAWPLMAVLVVILSVWLVAVYRDAGCLPELVERKNAEILEKFK